MITHKGRRAAGAFVTAIAIALAMGCQPTTTPPSDNSASTYKDYLYMTDGANGKVYYYDPATETGSSTSLVTTAGGAGDVSFYDGIGYVACGYGGIYYFDPSSSAPSATLVAGSSSLCAQYFLFYSATKAYFSVYDYSTASNRGIYTFNPSSPTTAVSSVISGTSGDNFQEIVLGADGMVYAANNTSSTVLKINPATDAVTATITAKATGTTGLYAGTYNGHSGVFVANTAGSIDFIASDATISTVADSSIYPSRVLQLSNGNLIATGYDTSYVNHSYLVTLTGTTATVTELKASGSSFGGGDIAYKDGLVYIPSSNYSAKTSALYVLDASGSQESYSPVTVMASSSDAMANIGFYE
jgi:YVTN family beta-propeller protein